MGGTKRQDQKNHRSPIHTTLRGEKLLIQLTLTLHDTQLTKTNSENRGVNRTIAELSLLSSYPSFNRHTGSFSSTYASLHLPQGTILLTKERTNVTKKTPSGFVAPVHATLPPISFRCSTDPKHISGGLSNDVGIGSAYVEDAEQHQRSCSRRASHSRAHVRTFTSGTITG